MNVSLLVPYRSDNGYREQAWNWVAHRWTTFFPSFEIVLGDAPGDFSRSAAINRAAAFATGDIFVIADCDTTFDSPTWIEASLSELSTWALAKTYQKLNHSFTEQLLNGTVDLNQRAVEYETDFSWSGIVIVKRSDFLKVGGFDEKFIKWGEEDICFGLLMNEVAGHVIRHPGYVCHLWHPQSRADTYGHSEWARQRELANKYRAAVGNKEAMLKVRFGGNK